MFRNILIICVCFKVLQIEPYPLTTFINKPSSDLQSRGCEKHKKIESKVKGIREKHNTLHGDLKEATDGIKGTKILIDPEMSIDDIKSALWKKKTENKKKVKSSISEPQRHFILLGQLHNTSKNEIIKSISKQYPKLVYNGKKLSQSNNSKKTESLPQPVYFLLQNDNPFLNLNDSDDCITVSEEASAITEEANTNNLVDEKLETTSEVCADSSTHTCTVSCKKTSIICMDTADEPTVGKTECKYSEEIESTSKKEQHKTALDDLFKLAIEGTTTSTDCSVEVISKSLQLLVDEENLHNSEEITKILYNDTKKQELQNITGGSVGDLQGLLNKQKIQINVNTNKNQNYTEHSKSGNEEKIEYKLKFMKPTLKEKNLNLKLKDNNVFFLRKPNNLSKKKIINTIGKHHRVYEKKLAQTNTDKKTKRLNEPVFVLLQDGTLSLTTNDSEETITDSMSTTSEEITTTAGSTATEEASTEIEEASTVIEESSKEIKEEGSTIKVIEVNCETTAQACVDLSDSVSEDKDTTAPCQQTSIICIDLMNESESATEMNAGETESNISELQSENTTQKGSPEEVFKLAIEDSSTVPSEHFSQTNSKEFSLDLVPLQDVLHDEMKKSEPQSSAESSEGRVHDILQKPKIKVCLDTKKNQNNNLDNKYGSGKADDLNDGESLKTNEDVKFIISNSTDENIFFDGTEEYELL